MVGPFSELRVHILGNDSLEDRADDVGHTATENVVKAHPVAGKLEALGENDMADRNDCTDAEGNESEGTVPTVLAVVRGEDHVASSHTCSRDTGCRGCQ